MRPEETYLLDGLKEGDPVVFKIIYQLYWQKLYNLAIYYVENENDAEDIVQDVFTSVWVRHEKICITVALENYLVRCAKYTTFFYLKVKKKHRKFQEAAPQKVFIHNNVAEISDYKSVMKKLQMRMQSVSQKTQDIFFMSRFDGLTYKEIAEKLEVSVKTVEYHVSQALKQIVVEDFY